MDRAFDFFKKKKGPSKTLSDDDDDSDDDMDPFEEMIRMQISKTRRSGDGQGSNADDEGHDDALLYYLLRKKDRRRHDRHRMMMMGSASSTSQNKSSRYPTKRNKDSEFPYPEDWLIPQMVDPVEDEKDQMDSTTDHGVVPSNAVLYALPEKLDDNSRKVHSILKMPSTLPSQSTGSTNTYNILMADVSASMGREWPYVVEHWNSYVAGHLVGKTKIFTFDNEVHFIRADTHLEEKDLTSGLTELTGALQTLVTEVYKCQEKYVNIFLITDGHHNCSDVQPQSVIDIMEAPEKKVCNVFLLGVGFYFPVQYSIDIRSRLQNGNSNIPSLYWAKETMNIKEQMEEIGTNLSSSVVIPVTLSFMGSSLPGLDVKNRFFLGDFVYSKEKPEHLMNNITMKYGNNIAQIQLKPEEVSTTMLLDIFRQWNTVIIQLKSKKQTIPFNVIRFMENILKGCTERQMVNERKTIRDRMTEIRDKREGMEVRTLISGIKSILTEDKFANEIELAEKILNTAVTRSKKKFEVKALQLKGHTDTEFQADAEAFMKVYRENIGVIQNSKVEPSEVCSITKMSTFTDLQDNDFEQLLQDGKFEFLKNFTITGIPVFSPMRDSTLLNPWSYMVQRILKSPYTIMSQVAMETMGKDNTDLANKTIQIQDGDDNTNFNAIVPIFPASVAKDMQPIIRTRIYAMCVTFATLKNPHIIDFNIHMAALAVTWVRLLFENPNLPLPSYVKLQMKSIEATAFCYMDRAQYANYAKVLVENTTEAMMTESNILVDGKPIKSETMIKPMFFLYIIQSTGKNLSESQNYSIMRLILIEFIGRCISHYKSGEEKSTPYTDFFAESLADQKRKEEYVQKYVNDSRNEISQTDAGVLDQYYTLEKVDRDAQKVAQIQLKSMEDKIAAEIPVKLSMDKINQLRNVSSAGDVSWMTLKVFARYLGLAESVNDALFSEDNVLIYTYHALGHRASRKRLSEEIPSYEDCIKSIKEKVRDESLSALKTTYDKAISSLLVDAWLKEYTDVHSEVVEPMTPQQIVFHAQQRGIAVTTETFNKVYPRYRSNVGLLGNACQTKACPYYLQPNRSYNQHASVERKKYTQPFMHHLHKTTYQHHAEEPSVIISEVASGASTRDKKPIPVEEVVKWSSDIKKLKNIYSEQKKGSFKPP